MKDLKACFIRERKRKCLKNPKKIKSNNTSYILEKDYDNMEQDLLTGY